jgi:hypothetical protein
MADAYWTFGPLVDLEPREALSGFLRAAKQFLKSLVLENRSPLHETLFWKDLAPDVFDAWMEVEPEFDATAERARHIPHELLVLHGLSGVQLRLKLRTVEFFHKRYQRFGRRAIKKVLDAIDNLLESIEDVLPGAGILSEFKEALAIALKP